VVIRRVQEPDWMVLVPLALPLTLVELETRVNVFAAFILASSLKDKVVGTLFRAESNTPPLGAVEKVKL
jgi:hypothetical protein